MSAVGRTVVGAVGREMIAGRDPAEVSRAVLNLLDHREDLLSENVLNYAVRVPE